MVGAKFTDPHKVVTELLTDYVNRQLSRPTGNKMAETMAHHLVGMRTARKYRVDISEEKRNVMAREFLRGVLSDHAV